MPNNRPESNAWQLDCARPESHEYVTHARGNQIPTLRPPVTMELSLRRLGGLLARRSDQASAVLSGDARARGRIQHRINRAPLRLAMYVSDSWPKLIMFVRNRRSRRLLSPDKIKATAPAPQSSPEPRLGELQIVTHYMYGAAERPGRLLGGHSTEVPHLYYTRERFIFFREPV